MSLQSVPGQTITEPVLLEDLKARLHLTATGDDTALGKIITQAREFAERVSGQALAFREFVYYMDKFPYNREPIRLPYPPLYGAPAIQYYDDTKTLQTLDASEYWITPAQVPTLIALMPGFVWPFALRVPNSVFVTFTAGYGYPGDSGANPPLLPVPIPVSFANNIMDIAVFIYDNPGTVVPESLVQIPKIFAF